MLARLFGYRGLYRTNLRFLPQILYLRSREDEPVMSYAFLRSLTVARPISVNILVNRCLAWENGIVKYYSLKLTTWAAFVSLVLNISSLGHSWDHVQWRVREFCFIVSLPINVNFLVIIVIDSKVSFLIMGCFSVSMVLIRKKVRRVALAQVKLDVENMKQNNLNSVKAVIK